MSYYDVARKKITAKTRLAGMVVRGYPRICKMCFVILGCCAIAATGLVGAKCNKVGTCQEPKEGPLERDARRLTSTDHTMRKTAADNAAFMGPQRWSGLPFALSGRSDSSPSGSDPSPSERDPLAPKPQEQSPSGSHQKTRPVGEYGESVGAGVRLLGEFGEFVGAGVARLFGDDLQQFLSNKVWLLCILLKLIRRCEGG